jgi:methane/ammonia monooxygenase subunit B
LILAFLLMQLSISIPGASGHGVKSNLLPGPIRVQEVFSSSEAAVGEVVTVSVTLTNLSENNFTASAGIFDEDSSSLHITSIRPDGGVDLGPGAVIDFDINARAVRPGIFHVHTSFQIEGLGNVLGPGQTITVYPEEVTVTTVEVDDKKVDVSFFLEEPIKIERAWVDKDTRSLLISLSGGSWDGSKMMTIWVPTDLMYFYD